MQHDVVNIQGQKVGTVALDAAVFGAPVDAVAVHAVVRWQRALRRAGTHQALTRSMMKGGGKKPYAQKHTGRARVGSIISPTRVGGAALFGPLPRDYEYKLPKGYRLRALRAVLSGKLKEQQLVVVDDLQLASGKTRDLQGVLSALGVAQRGAVVVLPEAGKAGVWRAGRNLPKVLVLPAAGVNVYDLCRHGSLVCTVAGLDALQRRAVRNKAAEGQVRSDHGA